MVLKQIELVSFIFYNYTIYISWILSIVPIVLLSSISNSTFLAIGSYKIFFTINSNLWHIFSTKNILILLLIVAFSYFIYKLVKFNVKKSQEETMLKLRLNELERQSILGQLKPHFLFNIITPFQYYLLSGDKEGGLKYFNQFSTLTRSLIEHLREKNISLKEELDFDKTYLEIQKTRFNDQFDFEIIVDPKINEETTYIPTMIIQPLLENAIEHGLEMKVGNGMVSLTFIQEDTLLVISIKDNGIGMPENYKPKKNHALQIITELLEIEKRKSGIGNLTINNLKNGTQVLLTVPLKLKNE